MMRLDPKNYSALSHKLNVLGTADLRPEGHFIGRSTSTVLTAAFLSGIVEIKWPQLGWLADVLLDKKQALSEKLFMSETQSVQLSSMVASIDDYLSLIENPTGLERERLNRLVRALDALVWEYHKSSDVDPDDNETEAPEIEYRAIYKRAGAAFPELGYYSKVDPIEGLEQCIGLADAIDDLTDIARDLKEVLWHIENTSLSNAVWEFRFGYQTHWGEHLHRLRAYLHTSTIAAW